MGCPVVQGFFLARPMTASELSAILPDLYDRRGATGVGLANMVEEVSPLA